MKEVWSFTVFADKDGVLFEALDDNLNVAATLSMEDFLGAFKEQKNA